MSILIQEFDIVALNLAIPGFTTRTPIFEQLTTHPFDIILLDLNLPDSRGLDTFSRIQMTVARPVGVTPVM